MIKRNDLSFAVISILIVAGIWFMRNSSHKQMNFEETRFLFQNGEATDQFVELLGLTGIRIKGDKLKTKSTWPEAKFFLSTRKLTEITQAIQGKTNPNVSWFIPKGKERWQSTLLFLLKKLKKLSITSLKT
jgi:hypothetical protein